MGYTFELKSTAENPEVEEGDLLNLSTVNQN
jgi:hypothetical protein